MAEMQNQDVHVQSNIAKFNGIDGQYGKSASLWLLEMNRLRDREFTPSMHLLDIVRHLKGEAARWALKSKNVIELVHTAYKDTATDCELAALQGLLTRRFRLTGEEGLAPLRESLLIRFLTLKQRTGEGLEEYYERVRDLLVALNSRSAENNVLTSLEISHPEMVVLQFVKGLSREALSGRLVVQGIYYPTVSLHDAFRMAEAESKIMDMGKQSVSSREKVQEQQRREGQQKEQQQREEQQRRDEEHQRKQQEARKRKLATDEKEPNSAKKQKYTMLKVHLPAPTKPNPPPPKSDQSDQSGETSDASDNESSSSASSKDDTDSDFVPKRSPSIPNNLTRDSDSLRRQVQNGARSRRRSERQRAKVCIKRE